MTTIKLKNGSGAPLAGDLVQGEPALDLTNKRLYTENSGGTVIEVGTNPSTINIDAGTIDGTVIGGSTAAAGSFTTLQADTSLNVDGTVTADGLTVDGDVSVAGAGNTRTIGFDFYGSSKYNFHVDGATDADKMFVRRGTANVATFDSSGNLLLGTTSTSGGRHFTIGNATAPAQSFQQNGTEKFLCGISGGINGGVTGSASGDYFARTTGGKMLFSTDDGVTAHAIINSSGNVGIGTSSPTGFSGYTSLDINNATNGAIIDLSQGDSMKGRLIATASTMAIETSSSVPIVFQPAGTERMRILPSGGITFNGDTAQANALDDYEEGTWTPVLSSSGYSFGTHTGTYVKVGKVVTVSALLNITAVGSSTSTINLSGYPFTASTATNQFQVGMVRQTSTTGVIYICQINVDTTVGGINSMDGVTSGSDKIFTTGNYGLSMTYIASS